LQKEKAMRTVSVFEDHNKNIILKVNHEPECSCKGSGADRINLHNDPQAAESILHDALNKVREIQGKGRLVIR
jgi:hypothetical protein